MQVYDKPGKVLPRLLIDEKDASRNQPKNHLFVTRSSLIHVAGHVSWLVSGNKSWPILQTDVEPHGMTISLGLIQRSSL
jgi:hypothetical protein